MRISTSNFYERSVASMLENQSRLSNTQEQLASGLRLNNPSDDPAATIRIKDLKETLNNLQQYDRNIGAAESRLASEESALDGVTNLLQRFRELLVQGNNATNNANDRDIIAAELRQHLDAFVDLANTQDANDEYIFSGYSTGIETLSHDGLGSFTFGGDEGQRELKIGNTRSVTVGDAGKEIFNKITAADGKQSSIGKVLFDAIDNFENSSNDTRLTVTEANWGAGDTATFNVTLGSQTINGITVTQGASTTGTFKDDFAVAINAAAPAGFGVDSVRVEGNDLVFTDSPNASLTATAVTDAAGIDLNIDIALGANAVAPTVVPAPVTPVILDITGGVITSATLSAIGNENEDDAYGLTDLDKSLERILQSLSVVGARRVSISQQNNINLDLTLASDIARSALEDLDYAEASGRFQLQLVALQASQQSFVQIQGLSLFNFL